MPTYVLDVGGSAAYQLTAGIGVAPGGIPASNSGTGGGKLDITGIPSACCLGNLNVAGISMAHGAIEVMTDGSPSPPCLGLYWPKSTYSFQWGVTSGTRTISINAKQASNGSPRPSMTVNVNSAIGVTSAVTGYAAGSTGWVTIGPLTVTPTSNGVLTVTLACNYQDVTQQYALFDNITTT